MPNVLTLRRLGLLNTVWSIILPTVFSPFYIFLLRQFMVGLPKELIEAAQIDGSGTFRSFIHVVIPVCRPILGAAAALSFADCWNPVSYTHLVPAGHGHSGHGGQQRAAAVHPAGGHDG